MMMVTIIGILFLIWNVVIFAWLIILTVLVCKLYSKKNKAVSCPNCGSTQIATVCQNSNTGSEAINICQNCGAKWELKKNI